MKYLSIMALMLFGIFSTNSTYAQKSATQDTIKVWGNCGMCKTTIEKNAKAAGAKTAEWNEDSKELIVSYASNKTSSNKIQQAVANAGYDTRDFTAPAEVYNKLHGCCKYERKEATAASAACCKDKVCEAHGENGVIKACCKEKAGEAHSEHGATAACCKDKTCEAHSKDGATKACCKGKECTKKM